MSDLADIVQVQILQDLDLAAVVEFDASGRGNLLPVPQTEGGQGRETRFHLVEHLYTHYITLTQFTCHSVISPFL